MFYAFGICDEYQNLITQFYKYNFFSGKASWGRNTTSSLSLISPSTSTWSTASAFLRTGLVECDKEATVEEDAAADMDTAVTAGPAGLVLHCPLSALSFLSLESCSLVETPMEGAGLGVLELDFSKSLIINVCIEMESLFCQLTIIHFFSI